MENLFLEHLEPDSGRLSNMKIINWYILYQAPTTALMIHKYFKFARAPFINAIHTYNLASCVPCVFVIKMVSFCKDLANLECVTVFVLYLDILSDL